MDVCFFFNDTATTEIYTLSLHDALPISFGQYRGELSANYSARRTGAGYEGATIESVVPAVRRAARNGQAMGAHQVGFRDRKSTRLNSSHGYISYAVFCLKT